MKTRRAVLYNVGVGLATFMAGGGLGIAGKEQAKKVVRNHNQKNNPSSGEERLREPEDLAIIPRNYTNKVNLPTVTVHHAADFTLGGVLGVVVKSLIGQGVKLRKSNKELASTISNLQKLERNDLPGIEKTLKEFVQKEGIKHESNTSNSLVESIQSLLDAILIHVHSQNTAVKPFLEELQKLRIAFSQPFAEQLQSSDINAAAKEAFIQVLRGNELVKYLETVVVKALQSSGVGEKIGRNAIDSLTEQELISNEGFIAIKQTMTEVFRSAAFREALEYALSTEITEYDTGDKIIEALCKAVATPEIAKDFVSLLTAKVIVPEKKTQG